MVLDQRLLIFFRTCYGICIRIASLKVSAEAFCLTRCCWPWWLSWMHVWLETRESRVQPPPRSATFFRGDRSWNIFYGHSLLDWLQSFLFYIYFSLSLHYFFIMILFNPTSSYLWLNKNFLSSQGTEVNKNFTSYTSVVSLQKKNKRRRRKRKKRKIKKGSGARLILSLLLIQEGQLSVCGERMCTILVNRLED